MMRVEVKPELLRWARERAGLKLHELARALRQSHVHAGQGERRETSP